MKEMFLKLVNDHSTNHVDVGAAGVGILAFFKYLPEVSAGLSVVWLMLRIFIVLRDEIFGKRKHRDDE